MVVFGSRTRGEASPDSDLDLFIEVSELTTDIREQIQMTAWEVSRVNRLSPSTGRREPQRSQDRRSSFSMAWRNQSGAVQKGY